MDKLSEMIKNIFNKFKGLSNARKIALLILSVGIILSMFFLSSYISNSKYTTLFTNMDPTDAGNIIANLKDKKIDYKVSGNNTILVPKDQVDVLRLELASEVQFTNGSKGFELLDESSFGTTDKEMRINYQRALEGELERTIKSFSEIDNARVHLVMPQDSVFVKDATEAKASVTLKLKQGSSINKEQVKAIVALLEGSVKNLPKENVTVIDDTLTDWTENLFEEDSIDVGTSLDKQQEIKKKVEQELENNIKKVLEPVYKNKFRVAVNADLDFDRVKSISTRFEQGPVVSESTVNDSTNNGQNQDTSSPVDNNLSNTTPNVTNNDTSSREEVTRNYDNSKVEEEVIKAPSAIKKVTASVVLDGNLDDGTRNSVRNLVLGAIGLDENRGDVISIEGLNFDTSDVDNAQQALQDMEAARSEEAQRRLYTYIGLGAAAFVALLTLIILVVRARRKKAPEAPKLDTVIGEDIQPKEPVKYNPIDFEENSEKIHMENEIKKYATEKPEQVADIIKSWLAEDEG